MNTMHCGITRIFCLFVSLILMTAWTNEALGQDEAEADTTGWQTEATASLNGSQASYNNWAEGGINSLAFTASVTGNAKKVSENWLLKHDVRLALGSLKQDSLDFRKADDLIQYTGTFEYKNEDAFAKWHPTAALTFRSQFADGFNYKTSPETKVSTTLTPAILTQTLGFTNQPAEWFTILIGIAGKETIVGVERFRPLYGNALDQTMRVEAGFNTTATFDKDIFENVHLKSALNLFGAFNQIENPDVRWENLLTMQVNSWLTVNFEYVTFYDRDITTKVQTKQVLSTGVAFKLL